MTTANGATGQTLPPAPPGSFNFMLGLGLTVLFGGMASQLYFRRRTRAAMLLVAIGIVLVSLMAGCGNTMNANKGTPAGSYVVTVSGNGTPGNVTVNAPSGVAVVVTR